MVADTGARAVFTDLSDQLVNPEVLGSGTILYTQLAVRGLPAPLINASVMITTRLTGIDCVAGACFIGCCWSSSVFGLEVWPSLSHC